MSHKVYPLALLLACASTVLASAQAASPSTDTNSRESSSPVAYIYVSSAVNSTTNHVNGYSAAANGSLTPIPGSPFSDNVGHMAINGAWLFGVGPSSEGVGIFSFSIGSNGALTRKDTYAVPSQDGAPINIWLDHTGATLYVDANSGDANDFLALSIDQSTGALSEVGDLSLGPGDESPMSFIGNNVFAYGSWFYEFNAGILDMQRASDGALSSIDNFSAPMPTPRSGQGYWPGRAAADPTKHLAIAVEPYVATSTGFAQAGPFQLATYIAQSDGSLTTNSTYENMPSVLVGTIADYWMSPSGKYLAVGGTSGLQLFHFSGADPITKFTGLITKDSINQLFWDNVKHLYAISAKSGKLFVFTVTSKGATQASGSPHAIAGPVNLIVLPK
jgi:6-phosphogluconolactonase (cycloisomerase 2 family)